MTSYQKIYHECGIVSDFMESYANTTDKKDSLKRLRTCQAWVGVTDDKEFTYLFSYNTLVAIIDNITGEAVDMLRVVYGYTATSSQHISKFVKDYNAKQLFRLGSDSKGSYYKRIW